MSWAALVKKETPVQAGPQAPVPVQSSKLAVVDANAIISGLRLEGVAERFVTIQDVLDEVRDKQSRQFLTTLPYAIEVREPAEESTKAGVRRLQYHAWAMLEAAKTLE